MYLIFLLHTYPHIPMSSTGVVESPVAVDFHQEHSPLIDQLSEPIIGQWNALVSQTNWEKGTIILNWRTELIAAGLPNTVYSDDAWARRVGNVSPQHVGKLRRVAERFGHTNQNFLGLYWSHFNSALDWDDAELWLEGAVQNGWSVAQMRVQRWESLGGTPGEQKPFDDNVVVADIDTADFDDGDYSPHSLPDRIEGRYAEISPTDAANAIEGFDASSPAAPNISDTPVKKKEPTKKDKAKQGVPGADIPKTGELLMSLNNIAAYPADLADPLELLKVAILNHKLSGWKTVSAEQVSLSLESLKMLTTSAD